MIHCLHPLISRYLGCKAWEELEHLFVGPDMGSMSESYIKIFRNLSKDLKGFFPMGKIALSSELYLTSLVVLRC